MSSSDGTYNPYINSGTRQLLRDIAFRGTVHDTPTTPSVSYDERDSSRTTPSSEHHGQNGYYHDSGFDGTSVTQVPRGLFPHDYAQEGYGLCSDHYSASPFRGIFDTLLGGTLIGLPVGDSGLFPFAGSRGLFVSHGLRNQRYFTPSFTRRSYQQSFMSDKTPYYGHRHNPMFHRTSSSSCTTPIVQEPDDDEELIEETESDRTSQGPIITELSDDSFDEPVSYVKMDKTEESMTDNMGGNYMQDSSSMVMGKEQIPKRNKNSTPKNDKAKFSVGQMVEQQNTDHYEDKAQLGEMKNNIGETKKASTESVTSNEEQRPLASEENVTKGTKACLEERAQNVKTETSPSKSINTNITVIRTDQTLASHEVKTESTRTLPNEISQNMSADNNSSKRINSNVMATVTDDEALYTVGSKQNKSESIRALPNTRSHVMNARKVSSTAIDETIIDAVDDTLSAQLEEEEVKYNQHNSCQIVNMEKGSCKNTYTTSTTTTTDTTSSTSSKVGDSLCLGHQPMEIMTDNIITGWDKGTHKNKNTAVRRLNKNKNSGVKQANKVIKIDTDSESSQKGTTQTKALELQAASCFENTDQLENVLNPQRSGFNDQMHSKITPNSVVECSDNTYLEGQDIFREKQVMNTQTEDVEPMGAVSIQPGTSTDQTLNTVPVSDLEILTEERSDALISQDIQQQYNDEGEEIEDSLSTLTKEKQNSLTSQKCQLKSKNEMIVNVKDSMGMSQQVKCFDVESDANNRISAATQILNFEDDTSSHVDDGESDASNRMLAATQMLNLGDDTSRNVDDVQSDASNRMLAATQRLNLGDDTSRNVDDVQSDASNRMLAATQRLNLGDDTSRNVDDVESDNSNTVLAATHLLNLGDDTRSHLDKIESDVSNRMLAATQMLNLGDDTSSFVGDGESDNSSKVLAATQMLNIEDDTSSHVVDVVSDASNRILAETQLLEDNTSSHVDDVESDTCNRILTETQLLGDNTSRHVDDVVSDASNRMLAATQLLGDKTSSHVDAIDLVAAHQPLSLDSLDDCQSFDTDGITQPHNMEQNSEDINVFKLGYRRSCTDFLLEDNRLIVHDVDEDVNDISEEWDNKNSISDTETLTNEQYNWHYPKMQPTSFTPDGDPWSWKQQASTRPSTDPTWRNDNYSDRRSGRLSYKSEEGASTIISQQELTAIQNTCPHDQGFYESHCQCCPHHTTYFIRCKLCNKNMDTPPVQQDQSSDFYMEDRWDDNSSDYPATNTIKGATWNRRNANNYARLKDNPMSSYQDDNLENEEPVNQTFNGYSRAMTESADRLQQLVEADGLMVKDVYPDGNCLFTAIVDQMRIRGQFNYTPRSLREAAVDYLRTHPKQDDGTPLMQFLTDFDGSWDDYLSRMEQDGEWGDHLILSAISSLLQRRIVIMRGLTSLHTTYVTPSTVSAMTQPSHHTEEKLTRESTREEQQPSDDKSTESVPTSRTQVDATPGPQVHETPGVDATLKTDIYVGHIANAHYVSLRSCDWKDKLYQFLAKTGNPCLHQPNFENQVDINHQHISFICASMLLEKQFWTRETMKFHQMKPAINRKIDNCRGKIMADITEALFVLGWNHEILNRQIHLDMVPDDTVVHFGDSIENRFGEKDLLAELSEHRPGFLRLVPKSPKLWYNYVVYIEGIPYLKHIPMAANHASRNKGKIQFQCDWPPCAAEWLCRSRPNNWPDTQVVQQIVTNGCSVCAPDMTVNVLEHVWTFDFSDSEQMLSDLALTSEQRQCFHIFKLLLDDLCQLDYTLLKHLFFYACEEVSMVMWKHNLSECVMLLIGKAISFLQKRFWPHYFLREQNLLETFPLIDIALHIKILTLVKEHPLEMFFVFISENKFMTLSLLPLYEKVMNGLLRYRDMQDTVRQCFVPAVVGLLKPKLLCDKFKLAMENVIMVPSLFASITEYEEGFSLNRILQSMFQMEDMHVKLHMRWSFLFMVDQEMCTHSLEEACRFEECVPLSDLFGNGITYFVEDTRATPVPVSLTKMPDLFYVTQRTIKFLMTKTRVPAMQKKLESCLLHFLNAFNDNIFQYIFEVIEFPQLALFAINFLSSVVLRLATYMMSDGQLSKEIMRIFAEIPNILSDVGSLIEAGQMEQARMRLGIAKSQLDVLLGSLQNMET